MEFKVGDVVKLKSGGPLMTVTGMGHSGGKASVNVTWFEGHKEHNSSFQAETLQHTETPRPMLVSR